MAKVEWHGDEIMTKARRATGRGIISIGEQIVSEAKQIVHVQSGTLRRSLHTAPADEMHFADEDEARIRDLNEQVLEWHQIMSDDQLMAVIEAGSWLPYACVEECGRQHHYVLPAYDMIYPTMSVTMRAAFAAEGF